MKTKTKLTLDDLDKSNVWTITCEELSQMIIDAKKNREEFAENEKHYMNIIKIVFDIQYLRREDTSKIAQLESIHYQVFSTSDEGANNAIAIRKHPIKRVTDLTLENIQHMSTFEVLELISNNMGNGWKGLSLSVQDVIESAFFVDCTIMPAVTMRKVGGIIDRRKEDGYEVLEIERGAWLEAIFMKPKPKVEKVRIDYSVDDSEDGRRKRRKSRDSEDDIEDMYEEDVEDEDMDEEELKKLDGDMEDDMEDDELDESNIQIEDIDVIEDVEDEDD